MPEHNFTLILNLTNGEVDDYADALYDAGCDDGMVGEIDGTPYVEFDREAPTLADAILSAIRDVESVDGLRVLHVEPDDLVTAAEIAERLGRTRESVRLLATGKRGGGSFPRPVSHIRTPRGRLWRWSDVKRWSGDEREDTAAVAAANAALELRALADDLDPSMREQVRALAG